MAPDVARAVAALAGRPRWTGEDDQVFAVEVGGYPRGLGAASAL
jgi:hypothetical protein